MKTNAQTAAPALELWSVTVETSDATEIWQCLWQSLPEAIDAATDEFLILEQDAQYHDENGEPEELVFHQAMRNQERAVTVTIARHIVVPQLGEAE